MHLYRWSRAALGLLLGGAALALALSTSGRPPAAAQAPAPAKADAAAYPLAELNKSFRAAYARARQQVLDQAGPIILAEGDSLVLRRGGKRSEVRYVPAVYHTLKAVSHIPLAIYSLLFLYGEGPLSEQHLADLRDYRRRIDGAGKELEGHLPEACLARQRQIITASQQFLDGVLKAKRVTNAELLAFTRRLGPLLLADIEDAARAELDAMHRQVMRWKAEMTPEEWKRLHVVVMGSAMPRKGNLSVQYFARLLREPGEGPRIVYAESLSDEGRAMRLLGTRLFDTDIGVAFFGDKHRMHRDLLEDAAEEYLAQMDFGP
jgi:hypothetical protein